MNDIAYAAGSFVGAAVIAVVIWRFIAFLALAFTKRPGLAAYLGGLASLWYAVTRDDTAGTLGATLAIVVVSLQHSDDDRTTPSDPPN